MGLEHGRTRGGRSSVHGSRSWKHGTRKRVYERVVDLARIGDTWLAQGSLACGRARMWDKRHGHAPGCGWGECHAGVMCVPRMWDKRHGHAPGCGWGECHAGVMCVPVCRCRRCVFYYLNDPQTYSPGGGPRHSSTPNPWPTCYNRSAAARESQYRYRCVSRLPRCLFYRYR